MADPTMFEIVISGRPERALARLTPSSGRLVPAETSVRLMMSSLMPSALAIFEDASTNIPAAFSKPYNEAARMIACTSNSIPKPTLLVYLLLGVRVNNEFFVFMCMDLREALRKDMETELGLIDFYMGFARRVDDDATRALLFRMVEESTMHYLRFKRLYLKRQFGLDVPVVAVSDVELSELLDRGMKEERFTRGVYEEQLAFCGDEEVSAVLKATIADESRHEKMLQDAFDRMRE